MTNASESNQERRWLLEPPEPGMVKFVFELGEGTELSPEVRAALDQLVSAISGREVEGFSHTGPGCYPSNCPKDNWCGLRYCPSEVIACPADTRLIR